MADGVSAAGICNREFIVVKYYLCVGLLLLAGCSGKAPQQAFELPPVPVQTADVEERDVPLFFEAMGTVRPSCIAEVKPQVNGLIQELHFIEGQSVEAGDVLFTIEDAPYAIRVQEMEAQLLHDQANLLNARKKLERFKSLTKQDLISRVEWDEAETQVVLREAAVKADEARLAAAHLDLKHCTIIAPIAGKTGISSLHAGNLVNAQTTLITLMQTDPLLVEFSMTEKELLNIGSSTPFIKIYAAGSDESLAEGKITFLDHSIAYSGMLAAKGVLSQVHKPLWPGQSVRVHVYYGKKDKARLIPMRAVKTNQSGTYIFVLNPDNTVEMRQVRLGAEERGQVVVDEGLDGVDKVVTEGHLRLFSGSKVEEVH